MPVPVFAKILHLLTEEDAIEDHLPFIYVPKSFESDAVANTDKQNPEIIPDLSDQAPPL